MTAALLLVLLSSTPPALSADEAVARALAHNPELEEAVATARASRAALRAAQDARTPRLTIGVEGGREERLGSGASGPVKSGANMLTPDATLAWNSPIGTSLGLTVGANSTWPDAGLGVAAERELRWSAGLEARQPLLRGAGTSAVLAAERAAVARSAAAEATRLEAASRLVRDVRLAHRALSLAEEVLRIAGEAEQLAARQRQDAEAKERALGTIPKVEVLRFLSEHAAVRRNLEGARRERTLRALELARLMGAPPDEPAPTAAWSDATIAGSLAAAPLQTPALLAAEAELEAARERLVQADDAARLRLDLTGRAGLATLSTPSVSLADALANDQPAWQALVGAQLELPLGAAREHAEAAGAAAELRAAEARLRQREEALQSEWRGAQAELTSSREELALAKEAADAARALAEAERARLQLGTSVATELLAAQQGEREGALSARRAEAAYEAAALRLSHLTGVWLAELHDAGGGP